MRIRFLVPFFAIFLLAAATRLADTWIVINWSVPDDGKGPIDSVLVSMSYPGFGETHAHAPTVTRDSFLVPGVLPGVPRSVNLRVQTARGGVLVPTDTTFSWTAVDLTPPAPVINTIEVK